MIKGIGIDLVDVARMERILSGSCRERLLARLFCPEEIATCSATLHPAQCFAARFAAKEAFAKALGTGFAQGVAPRDIHVHRSVNQRPSLSLTGGARHAAEMSGIYDTWVSLSHTSTSAIAMVVLIGER